MVIFLDFDGVLHPDAVYRPRNKPLALRAEGSLFMHAQVLEEIIKPFDVEIILSTSWVRELGFDRTIKKMPEHLSKRVEGATWHRGMLMNGRENDPFSWMSRFEQIAFHVKRNGVKNWLAIDDLHSGTEAESWPIEMRKHLVLTDGELGMSCIKAQQELQEKLR